MSRNMHTPRPRIPVFFDPSTAGIYIYYFLSYMIDSVFRLLFWNSVLPSWIPRYTASCNDGSQRSTRWRTLAHDLPFRAPIEYLGLSRRKIGRPCMTLRRLWNHWSQHEREWHLSLAGIAVTLSSTQYFQRIIQKQYKETLRRPSEVMYLLNANHIDDFKKWWGISSNISRSSRNA